MEKWECIYYYQYGNNKPFCQEGMNINQCSSKCKKNFTLQQSHDLWEAIRENETKIKETKEDELKEAV